MRLKNICIFLIFCFVIPFTASLYINIASAYSLPSAPDAMQNTEAPTGHPDIFVPGITPSPTLSPTVEPKPSTKPTAAPLATPNAKPAYTVEDVPAFSADTTVPERLFDAEVTIKVYNRSIGKVVQMNLRDYLISCVAGEMPASFELEALKAQAVAARTFTVSHLSSSCNTSSAAHVCTYHGCCQAYASPEQMKRNWGNEFDEKYAKVKAAVECTDSVVMLYDGKPITVFYFSTSNGYTDACQDVFSKNLPYYQSVISPGEETASGFYSHKKLTRSEFADIISENFGITLSPGEIEHSIDITRTSGGRVDYIAFNGTKIRGTKIRTAFGLKSADFYLTFDEDSVVFEVYGYGHGVGMSQLGANHMAKQGIKYTDILRHYYIGVEIVQNQYFITQ